MASTSNPLPTITSCSFWVKSNLSSHSSSVFLTLPVRSSIAFNIDTIILSEDSVNLYNDKVVRSSEGMIFNTNIITMNLKEAIKDIKNKNIKVYGTDLKGSKYLSEFDKPSSFALILGNEGMGTKKEILDLCDENIKIEMSNNCESLNVGVAGSIILYEWRNL